MSIPIQSGKIQNNILSNCKFRISPVLQSLRTQIDIVDRKSPIEQIKDRLVETAKTEPYAD